MRGPSWRPCQRRPFAMRLWHRHPKGLRRRLKGVVTARPSTRPTSPSTSHADRPQAMTLTPGTKTIPGSSTSRVARRSCTGHVGAIALLPGLASVTAPVLQRGPLTTLRRCGSWRRRCRPRRSRLELFERHADFHRFMIDVLGRLERDLIGTHAPSLAPCDASRRHERGGNSAHRHQEQP